MPETTPTPTPTDLAPTDLAQRLYESRQARLTHPAGTFDRAGRWYPDPDERRSCCDAIRSPSRNWPYSLLCHCRTLKHCRNLLAPAIHEMETAR